MNDAAGTPLRVLEIETFGRGGLIHYAFNLSGALAGRGHRVDLVTADGFELADRELPSGVRLHTPVGRLGRRFGRGWPGAAATLGRKVEAVLDARAVARLARDIGPDVIHLHSTNTSAVVYLRLLRRLGAPLVATAHQVTPHEPIAFQDAIYKRIHGLPDLVIAHSEVDRRRLADEFGVGADRVAVIPHGDYGFFVEVDDPRDRKTARARLGLGADEPVALFFGYLREYKGLDLLLDAWPEVAAAVPGARLVIAGDPVRLTSERRDQLRRQADELGAIHRFEYIPFDEVSWFFAAADLLVLPYRSISQSGVLYLALAFGVPVVATAVGAWPEMLSDGESALLIPPDSPAELASAVAQALGDPTLQSRLADGGRRVAAAHSWPAVAGQTERAFGSLLGR
ncbi:MAG: glycosyltransferase family 4 protein [Thermoanaerobaculales bacterium]|jgi:glycosyltransferase involved in cell wall biosynthesis|nr:glycosyltransferase family 4 protein [Thermoanaerobaculales bacterium]